MRIACVYFDGAERFKGPGVNVSRLLPELVRRGHEVHGLCLNHGGQPVLSAHLTACGVTCHIGRPSIGYVEDDADWLLRTVREIAPDIYVGNLCVAGWYAARWIRAAGIATVACNRSDDDFHRAMVERFVCGSRRWAVSGLVCVSQDLQRSVQQRKPEWTQTCVAPSGVPIPETVANIALPLRIVYAGRIAQKQKRVLDMLEGVMGFLESDRTATFTIIGDGPQKEDCAHLIAQSSYRHRIHLQNAVEPWEIQSRLQDFNVALLLSDYEGTPGFVMDAMACGLAPVCMDIKGGVSELIEDGVTGFLVRDRGEALRRRLGELSRDASMIAHIAGAARRRVSENFSIGVAADVWETFCCELVQSTRKARSRIRIPKIMWLPPSEPLFRSEDRRRPLSPRSVWRGLEKLFGVTGADSWLNPTLTPQTLDLFTHRASLLRAIKAILPSMEGIVLDVGCGRMPYRALLTTAPSRVSRYIGMDLDTKAYHTVDPDMVWDGETIPLGAGIVDVAFCTEVLEHVPEPTKMLTEIHRVLKPTGCLFLTVPFLWPIHDAPGDYCRYTPFAIERYLRNAGFGEIAIQPLGGWDASLAQMLGLWARRRPMPSWKRRVLTRLAVPIIRYLLARDVIPVDFNGGPMMTGIAVLARRQ